MPDDSRHQVNLLDFFAFLVRWRVFILTAVLTVSVIVAVLTFVLPAKYRSTASVRAQESSGQSMPALIASKLGALGGLGNLVSKFGEVPEEMYISILKSRWMSTRLIDQFDLRSVYRMRDAHEEDVIKALQSNSRFDLDEMSSILTVEVEDQDAGRAQQMAAFYVDELDARNQELKSFAAQKERDFIGQRLAEERSRLGSLEDSLYHFQVASGVLDIEEQTKAALQAAAALEAQKLLARTELELNSQVWGELSPETEYTRLKLASIDSSLRTLVRPDESAGDNILIELGEVPKQGLTYARLYRDIEIQQLLVGYLLQQYEQARIDELRNTPTLMRIDPASYPTKRSWPRRSLFVIIAFMATFVVATLIAMGLEMYRAAASNPAHPQHPHIQNLLTSWRHNRQA